MCLILRVIETSQKVFVPNVGAMLRVAQCTEDGELLGLVYRWPTRPKPVDNSIRPNLAPKLTKPRWKDPEPPSDDLMRPKVWIVSAAHADSADPTR